MAAKAAVSVNMSGGNMKMMRGRIIQSGKNSSRKNAFAVKSNPSMTEKTEMMRSGWKSTHTRRGRNSKATGKEVNQLENESEKGTLLSIKITMKSLRVLIKNQVAYLSSRSEWLSHILKKRGIVKREASGRNTTEREHAASNRRGIR